MKMEKKKMNVLKEEKGEEEDEKMKEKQEEDGEWA
jgi:hypothetical protein